MRYAHTNLICEDWKKQVKFYCKVFNCKKAPPKRMQKGKWLSNGTGVTNSKLTGMHLFLPGYRKGGPTLELYTFKKNKKRRTIAPNHPGFGHIAFEVGNVKKVIKKLLKHGGSLNGEIVRKKVNGVGIITFVYARDPEGNLLEVQNWKYDKK